MNIRSDSGPSSTITKKQPGEMRQASHSRVPELDGIRAIAIWMVLVSHMFFGWPVADGAFKYIPRAVLQGISHGWLGVDLFFVLSGFLITGILLDSRGAQHYFRNFYARRFLRIMPLYFTVVLICAMFYRNSWSYFILSTFFAANLAHMFGIAVPHGPGVLWSLAVEEHFYLLWPVLVFLLSRRRLVTLAIAIIVLTPIARGLAVAHGMPVDATVYAYSWFRFDGLALGGLLAIAVRWSKMSQRTAFGLAGALIGLSAAITIVGAFFGLMHKGVLGTALRFNQAQFIFGAMLLTAYTLRGTSWTRILRTRLARTSGDLSYCIYLIHLSIGDGVVAIARRLGWNTDAALGGLGSVLTRGLIIISASFLLAMLSKKFLEEPFLKLKRHFVPGAPDARSRKIERPTPVATSPVLELAFASGVEVGPVALEPAESIVAKRTPEANS